MLRKWPNLGPLLVAIAVSIAIAAVVSLTFPYYENHAYQNQHASNDEHQATNKSMTIIISIGNFLDSHSGALTAIATLFIAAFTVVLACATRRIYQHSAASERAYLNISHKTPPSFLIATPLINGRNTAEIKIKFKNHGETPGRLVEFAFTTKCIPHGDTLGPRVEYGTMTPTLVNASLVPRGNIIYKQPSFEFNADMLSVVAGKLDLWLIGYADYVDTFGDWHRKGYARLYDPNIPTNGNNLIFGPERGHNNEWDIRKRKD